MQKNVAWQRMAKVKQQKKPMKNLGIILVIFALGLLAGLFFSERQNAPVDETAGQTIGRLIDKGIHKMADGASTVGSEAGTKASGWLGEKLDQMGDDVRAKGTAPREEALTPPHPVDPTPSGEI